MKSCACLDVALHETLTQQTFHILAKQRRCWVSSGLLTTIGRFLPKGAEQGMHATEFDPSSFPGVMYCSLGAQTHAEWAGRRQRCLKTSWNCVNSGQKRLQLELCNLCDTLPIWTCQTKRTFGAGQCRRFLKQERKGQLDSMKPRESYEHSLQFTWNTMKMLAPRWFVPLKFHQKPGAAGCINFWLIIDHPWKHFKAIMLRSSVSILDNLNLWQDSFQSGLHNTALSDNFSRSILTPHTWRDIYGLSCPLCLLFLLAHERGLYCSPCRVTLWGGDVLVNCLCLSCNCMKLTQNQWKKWLHDSASFIFP